MLLLGSPVCLKTLFMCAGLFLLKKLKVIELMHCLKPLDILKFAQTNISPIIQIQTEADLFVLPCL